MIPLALKPASPQRHGLWRTRGGLLATLAQLWDRPALDHVEAPAGLLHAPGERSRRLMRNARVCGG